MTDVCREFVACLPFLCCVMKIALFCMNVMLEEIVISFMNLCLRLKIFSIPQPVLRCWCSFLLLVVNLLSSKMATEQIDFLKGSIDNKECEQSTWRLEPLSFARSERKCVTLHQRASDNNFEDTKYAIENVIALMCSNRLSCRFSARRNWEVDFVCFLLGYTTCAEEHAFNSHTLDHNKMRSDPHSVTKKIGKAMTAMTAILRHGGRNKRY